MERSSSRRLAKVVIAVTIQRLLANVNFMPSFEEQLVIDAIRRSTNALEDASLDEIREYVGAMTPDQAQGFLNNVKGIYHELLVAHAENVDGDEVFARVHEATNHPGSDIEFIVDGEVISAVQLKATDSIEYVQEHLNRYPEIHVVATQEVASELPTIQSSGYSNTELSESVEDAVRGMSGDVVDGAPEAAANSVLVGAALQAGGMLRAGKVSKHRFRQTMKDVAVGGGTAAVLELLIG